ncbi:ATP-dependent DNA ligase [Salinibacterium sp. dk2585]|nr:ATP-dependent DNA ligase [Salinibacterium sp. dk2585]TXK53661.1 ATP-dependent DNA ligase [Salinibacterium sp. dk5596]
MGFMLYDGTSVQFDDRLLAHLQIVMVQKLMKQESFLVSWKDGPSLGDGRGSFWMSPNTPIYFKFLGSRTPEINQEWLLQLGHSADSSQGLVVTDEDGTLAVSGSPDQFPGTI